MSPCTIAAIPRWPAVAIVAVLAFAPADAEACSCGWSPLTLPQDGTTGVPIDARVWLGTVEDGMPLQLERADGTVVETTRTVLRDGRLNVVVLTPTAPLAPDTEFVARNPIVTWRFSTGSGASSEPPSIPRVSGRRGVASEGGFLGHGASSCDPVYGTRLSLVPDESRLLTVVAWDGATLQDFAGGPGGSVGLVHARQEWTGDDLPLINGACEFGWPGAVRGSVGVVRIGAFDLGGRFSGWSEPLEIAADSDGIPGGCASSAVGAAGLLGLALRRRTRRWPAASAPLA